MAIDLTNSIEISNRQSDRRTQSRLTNDIYGLLRICFATHISNSSLLPTIECRIYELYRETRSERGEEEKKKNSDQWPFKVKTQNSSRLFINCFELRGFLFFVILFVPLHRATSRQQPQRQYCCSGISVLKCFFVCILFHGHLINSNSKSTILKLIS